MIVVNIFIGFPQKYNHILQINLLIVVFINLLENLLKRHLIISLLWDSHLEPCKPPQFMGFPPLRWSLAGQVLKSNWSPIVNRDCKVSNLVSDLEESPQLVIDGLEWIKISDFLMPLLAFIQWFLEFCKFRLRSVLHSVRLYNSFNNFNHLARPGVNKVKPKGWFKYSLQID